MGLLQLEHERFAWAKDQFPEATAVSSLQHLKKEIEEIEEHLNANSDSLISDNALAEEYADALMCLLDSAERVGIGPGLILDWFRRKLDINKSRTWSKNEDNSYSHIKDPAELKKPKSLEQAAEDLKENTELEAQEDTDAEILKRAIELCSNHQNTSPTFIQSQFGMTLTEATELSQAVEANLFSEKAHKTIKLKPDPEADRVTDEFTNPVKVAKKKLDKRNDFMD